jgi:hypothetical protein
VELRALICRMARENPVWGEERIASELLVKLGIQVSPRTVRKFMPKRNCLLQGAFVPRAIKRTFCGRSGDPRQGAEGDSCHFAGALNTKSSFDHA